ncbi:FecR domain-containing protein [Paludibacter sp.]
MLFRTKELEEYWDNYIQENPQEKETFERAKEEFSKIRINAYKLSEKEQTVIYNRILKNIEVKTYRKGFRRKRIRYYISAAAVFALILASTYFYINMQPYKTTIVSESDIIGLQLPEEKVYLLSNNDIIKLEDNSNLSVSQQGKITLKNGELSERSLDRTTSSSVNTLVVPYGKRSFIKLSDGSNVWINSGSKLSFPTVFDKDKREIQVEGEVFIEVEKMKDKPFIVKAGDMTIQVYGTVFNVSTYANDGENYVVLVEGSVKVSTTHENIILEPNKRAIIKGDHISTHDTDVNDFISWKNGYLILKQESLSGVLKKVERYYNISFSNKSKFNFDNERLSGKLYLSSNIDSVMNSLSSIYSFTYDRDEDIISLSK